MPESQDLKNLSDKELIHKYREEENRDAFQELMRRSGPAIDEGIQTWGGGNTSLKMRARLIAADAIKKYNPEKADKVSVRTWVSNNMPTLSRYRDDRTSAMHVPDSTKQDVRYLTQIRQQHKDKYGTEPSVGWLKDQSGMSEKRIKRAREAFAEAGEQATEEGDILGAKTDDDNFKMWVDSVYAELDDPGKKIFEGVSGYMGSPIKKKQDLAKELNMSPAAITSRINTIQNRLQEFRNI